MPKKIKITILLGSTQLQCVFSLSLSLSLVIYAYVYNEQLTAKDATLKVIIPSSLRLGNYHD